MANCTGYVKTKTKSKNINLDLILTLGNSFLDLFLVLLTNCL